MVRKQEWLEERRRKERREILERRRQQREKTKDRREDERRQDQVCFVCRRTFVPKASGEVVCPQCQIDGVRGGTEKPPKSMF